MIEIWLEETTGKIVITVRGESINLSKTEAIRLKDGLASVLQADDRKGTIR